MRIIERNWGTLDIAVSPRVCIARISLINSTEHVAHSVGKARILVIEKEGSV
ncbi:hypothetical protein [Marinomonas alcarazii]|uniref:hypothetical protein n=1 Tax=Marinomonas alcarazii TaxID=491949 RepID=UPI001FE499DE|nr:hypothetical protein [Marinomonas alcarazii]